MRPVDGEKIENEVGKGTAKTDYLRLTRKLDYSESR